ncbi:hypothetical protein BVX94_02255 [bacterium B17]|nr:hypothetical protein BVX94_02255 [bacterium B17]
MNQEKKGPISKARVGRFQATVWKKHKVLPADESGFSPEREFDIVRACVQYSRYNKKKGAYERQQIWCNPEELRCLADALDKLGNEGGDVE